MALNRSDKSRILRRYFPGMTRNSEMSTEPSKPQQGHSKEPAMNPSLESMLDPEHLAQPLPGAIYLAAPYTAQEPAVEQARMQAVKHVSDWLIRQGQVVFSPLEYTEAMQQRGIVPPQGWYLFDLAMLRGCVKLLVLALPGWRESQGVIMETAAAKALGIPVEVLTVEEAGLPCDLERQLAGTV